MAVAQLRIRGRGMTRNCATQANTYIDFFAGCGGLSLGLGMAGWQGVFAIEKDPMAYASFEKNLIDKDAPHHHFDRWPAWLPKSPHTIEDVLDDDDIVQHLKDLSGKVTLVAGGPPCQGFLLLDPEMAMTPEIFLYLSRSKLSLTSSLALQSLRMWAGLNGNS